MGSIWSIWQGQHHPSTETRQGNLQTSISEEYGYKNIQYKMLET